MPSSDPEGSSAALWCAQRLFGAAIQGATEHVHGLPPEHGATATAAEPLLACPALSAGAFSWKQYWFMSRVSLLAVQFGLLNIWPCSVDCSLWVPGISCYGSLLPSLSCIARARELVFRRRAMSSHSLGDDPVLFSSTWGASSSVHIPSFGRSHPPTFRLLSGCGAGLVWSGF